jgi:hypothetical protein
MAQSALQIIEYYTQAKAAPSYYQASYYIALASSSSNFRFKITGNSNDRFVEISTPRHTEEKASVRNSGCHDRNLALFPLLFHSVFSSLSH